MWSMALLPAILVLLLHIALAELPFTCTQILPRKEIRDLKPRELQDFLDALQKIRTPLDSNGLSAYDRLVKIHSEAGMQIHGYVDILFNQ